MFYKACNTLFFETFTGLIEDRVQSLVDTDTSVAHLTTPTADANTCVHVPIGDDADNYFRTRFKPPMDNAFSLDVYPYHGERMEDGIDLIVELKFQERYIMVLCDRVAEGTSLISLLEASLQNVATANEPSCTFAHDADFYERFIHDTMSGVETPSYDFRYYYFAVALSSTGAAQPKIIMVPYHTEVIAIEMHKRVLPISDFKSYVFDGDATVITHEMADIDIRTEGKGELQYGKANPLDAQIGRICSTTQSEFEHDILAYALDVIDIVDAYQPDTIMETIIIGISSLGDIYDVTETSVLVDMDKALIAKWDIMRNCIINIINGSDVIVFHDGVELIKLIIHEDEKLPRVRECVASVKDTAVDRAIANHEKYFVEDAPTMFPLQEMDNMTQAIEHWSSNEVSRVLVPFTRNMSETESDNTITNITFFMDQGLVDMIGHYYIDEYDDQLMVFHIEFDTHARHWDVVILVRTDEGEYTPVDVYVQKANHAMEDVASSLDINVILNTVITEDGVGNSITMSDDSDWEANMKDPDFFRFASKMRFEAPPETNTASPVEVLDGSGNVVQEMNAIHSEGIRQMMAGVLEEAFGKPNPTMEDLYEKYGITEADIMPDADEPGTVIEIPH